MIDENDKQKKYQENLKHFILDNLQNNYKEIYDQLEEKFQNVEPVINQDSTNNSGNNSPEDNNTNEDEKMKTMLKNLIAENKTLIDGIKKIQEESNLIKVEFTHQVKSLKNTIEVEKELIIRRIANPLVSILSTIDLAKNSCQHDQNILIGIEMLEKQFLDVLMSFKIEKILIKVGDEFDPNTCECIEKTVTTDIEKNNKVQHVLSYPFKLNDKLLNPGKVGIFQIAS